MAVSGKAQEGRQIDAPEPGPRGAADSAEVAKFGAMADEWWNPAGKFAPLHAMNPCRLAYVRDQIAAEHGRDVRDPTPFAGLRLLDIGCGGGLMAEPMCRLGAEVTGLDPSGETVGIARAHAEAVGLAIDYRETTAEDIADGGAQFDVVLALEVVEHVPDVRAFMATVGRLVTPGGLVVVSTLNRTRRAWALAIVAAERVLRWLPAGTHDWNRFVTPDELAEAAAAAGLETVDRTGMVLDPLWRDWRLSRRDLAVNYIATLRPPRGRARPEMT